MLLSDILGWRIVPNAKATRTKHFVKETVVGVFINAKGNLTKQTLYIEGPCTVCGSDFAVAGYREQYKCTSHGCPDTRIKFEDINHLNERSINNLNVFYSSILGNGDQPQGPEINEESMREAFSGVEPS